LTGVFRPTSRPQPKQPYLPSKTPAVSPTSLLAKNIDVRQFTEHLFDYYKAKKHVFGSTSAPKSILYRKPFNQANQEERYFARAKFLPTLTPATTSLAVPSKPDLQRFFETGWTQPKKQLIFGFTPAGPTSLVFTRIYPERLVFQEINDRSIHHYKTQKRFKLISTVAPPPGTGSAAFVKHQNLDVFFSVVDWSLYTSNAYIKEIKGAPLTSPPVWTVQPDESTSWSNQSDDSTVWTVQTDASTTWTEQ
jgi:hypothetical protein